MFGGGTTWITNNDSTWICICGATFSLDVMSERLSMFAVLGFSFVSLS